MKFPPFPLNKNHGMKLSHANWFKLTKCSDGATKECAIQEMKEYIQVSITIYKVFKKKAQICYIVSY